MLAASCVAWTKGRQRVSCKAPGSGLLKVLSEADYFPAKPGSAGARALSLLRATILEPGWPTPTLSGVRLGRHGAHMCRCASNLLKR